ncbi:hypothetical protein JB92DRAFT_3148979 [Gautieria morchelliformis]|nr:hypothetical protein JB92DRAFT_3148979 [Gautieria morchelliformis]
MPANPSSKSQRVIRSIKVSEATEAIGSHKSTQQLEDEVSNDGEAVKAKKKKRAPDIKWDSNHAWTHSLIQLLIDQPDLWCKLFSDSTRDAKDNNQRKLQAKDQKIHLHGVLAKHIFEEHNAIQYASDLGNFANLKKTYARHVRELGATGAGLEPEDVTPGSDIANKLDAICEDFPFWDDLHPMWCELPNYNAVGVTSLKHGCQRDLDEHGTIRGEETTSRIDDMPGNNAIGSDDSVVIDWPASDSGNISHQTDSPGAKRSPRIAAALKCKEDLTAKRLMSVFPMRAKSITVSTFHMPTKKTTKGKAQASVGYKSNKGGLSKEFEQVETAEIHRLQQKEEQRKKEKMAHLEFAQAKLAAKKQHVEWEIQERQKVREDEHEEAQHIRAERHDEEYQKRQEECDR